MSRIWSKIKVKSWTSVAKIEFQLERTKRITLDIEIDTKSDSRAHPPDSSQSYSALVIVAGTARRWRNLTIHSFPTEAELLRLGPPGTSLSFNGPMEYLQSFRITGPCEINSTLGNLIGQARGSQITKLTALELSESAALYRFTEVASTLFCNLRTFKADFAEMQDHVDILPHFQHLEEMYAHRLHLPSYSATLHLPLTRTLKRLFLKSTAVQWMAGRTFSNLVECTILWPHYPETLLGQDGIGLPVRIRFIYDDHVLQPLTAFSLPSLDELVIHNEAWNRPRGGQQLGFLWGPNPIEPVLRPRILHLDTQCYDQHLIIALELVPQVEELALGVVRPNALGKKFFSAMVAKKGKETSQSMRDCNVSGPNGGPTWTVKLCPNLKVFAVKYRRWLREHETDDLTPLFLKIVETRSKSDTPLQSFKVWPTKDTMEQEARELVTESYGSGLSYAGPLDASSI